MDFHGEQRHNETHASSTDLEARLWRKGPGHVAKLCYMAHVLMDNKHGMIRDSHFTLATGTAEREAAWEMVKAIPGKHWISVGGDKNYDSQDFIKKLRSRRAVPHVARKRSCSALDGRTTRHAAYALSQRLQKRVEEIFGWLKTIGHLRKTRHRGRERVAWVFTFTMAAYNLVRMRNLLAAKGRESERVV